MTTKTIPKKMSVIKLNFHNVKPVLRKTIEEAIELDNLSIVPPCNDGSKRPFADEWAPFQKKKASKKQLSEWYGNGLTGFGLICGAVSDNLECLDFDSYKVYENFCLRMKKFGLLLLLNRMKKGYYERTPNGVHFLYRCSEIGGNTKLATKPGKSDKKGATKTVTLIETRGEGGFIICAPSRGRVNPDGDYKLISGGLSSIPKLSAAQRDDLHSVARSFHIDDEAKLEGETTSIRQNTLNNAGRPGDDFNRRAQWSDVLPDWTKVYERNGMVYLRRPGKSKGVSATINYLGKDLFRNFSTSTSFELKYYDKFGAYAAQHHNGNCSAAAKQLILDGYGGPGNVTKDVQDDTTNELGKISFPEIPFPIEVLPKYFRRLVNAFANALQCPPAFMAMLFITIVSGAAGNSIAMGLKRKWKAAPFIWFYIIGDTGDGKSPPEDAAMEVIHTLQDIEKVKYLSELEEYNQASAQSQKNRNNAEHNQAELPKMRHFYSNNFTIESLVPMFQVCSRGVVLHIDELAGLFNSFNQYKGGKGSDLEQFISLFDCKSLKVDRKTGSDMCSESGVAVIGGIQPDRLPHVFNDKMHQNGLAYRFLPMMLDIPPHELTDNDVSEQNEAEWSNIIKWVYAIPAPAEADTRRLIRNNLSIKADSWDALKIFFDEISKLRPFMPKRFKGYLPKLKTYCLKFMAVIHLLKCYQKGTLTLTVQKSSVEGAIALTRYFAGQAMKLTLGTTTNTHNDPYSDFFRKALISLKDEFSNGKILLKRVRDCTNELLPESLKLGIKDKKLGTWLRAQGLEVKEGTANKTYVLWNDSILG